MKYASKLHEVFPPKVEERDPNWEVVWAYVGTPQGYIHDEEADPRHYTQFLIEVVYNGRICYANTIHHTMDLVDYDSLYRITLNRMVKNIDTKLKES